jgi:hypothetical protein
MSTDVRLGTSGKVARQCACRGWIIASETLRPETGEAVAEHQEELIHRSWDVERWREANTARVNVPVRLVKVA